MEISITLHTSGGDVTTSYPASRIEDALCLIRVYTIDGKNFSVKHEGRKVNKPDATRGPDGEEVF